MTDKKMVTVYHPTFPDTSTEVAASEVSRWTDAGWRKTPLDSSSSEDSPSKAGSK